MLLTTDAVGGVWRYSLDLAQGLADRGVTVVLAVMGRPASTAQRAEAEAIAGLRMVQTGLPLDWTADGPASLRGASERLAALASLSGAGSVHLHAPALVGSVRWPAPVVAVAHSCLGTWWRAMRDGPPPEDFAWRIGATRIGLHTAAAVIAPSAAHAAAIHEIYGAREVTVVHNGSTPPSVMPARHGPPGPPLTAGRLWDEAKGAATIDAAAALDPGLQIRAAGPVKGPNGAEIDLPNLHLLGTLDAAGMQAAYADAGVFVSMARYEPFGLSVLEAANAGLPLVLSDIPTFRELWDGAATFTAEADLVPTLHALRQRPGDGGAKARAARYTTAAMVAGTLAVHAGIGRPG